MGGYASDAAIQGIIFHPDGGFDISYAEQRHITKNGTKVQQLMVAPGVASEQVEEVLDLLRELLDAALRAQDDDDPATRISRR